jgi:hypothetical protein
MFDDVKRSRNSGYSQVMLHASEPKIKKSIGQLFDDMASDCPNMNKHEEDLQLQQIKN